VNGIFYNNTSMEATVFIIPDDIIKILIFFKARFCRIILPLSFFYNRVTYRREKPMASWFKDSGEKGRNNNKL